MSYFTSTHSIRNVADSNWSTGCWSPDKPDMFLTSLMCCSATDALKGEGLQEGVDWLQGTINVRVWAGQWDFNPSINLYRFYPSVYKQFTQWDVSDSRILFSFYHLHCFHSNSSIDQIIQWVLGGRPVLRYVGTQLCLWLVLSGWVSCSERMLLLPEWQKHPKIHTISNHCIYSSINACTHSLLSFLHVISPAGFSFPDQIKTIRTWVHEDGTFISICGGLLQKDLSQFQRYDGI